MSSVAETPLLTAEEFAELPDNGQKMELVRGRIVYVNVPYPRHGEICATIARRLGNFAEERKLGRVISNDSGVITERGPDTVRGMDVAFYSYQRVPPGPLPQGYLKVVPDLIFEVRSPSDRWPKILAKMAEYLDAGVPVVCIADQQTESVHVYQAEESVRIFTSDQELHLPPPLHEWRVKVGAFFA
jgi:Uma2 family endonuclease